jgi:antitoxin PrlF
MSILTVSSKGQINLPAALRRRLGMDAGEKIEAIEEADGLKLRVIRPIEKADISKFAGMVTAPSRGKVGRLEDFDPASILRRALDDDE